MIYLNNRFNFVSLFLHLILFLNNILNIYNYKIVKKPRQSPFYDYLYTDNINLSNNFNNNESSFNPQTYFKNNSIKIFALADRSVVLKCKIELDEINFLKSENYKIIWSREIENGKDYEPLALDDTRLVSNPRLSPIRSTSMKKNHEQIEWSLVIDNLKLSDSSNYICQLNKKPYDIYWLKKFSLNVLEPAHFVDEKQSEEMKTDNENSIFVKSVNEYDDFKLKCLAKGKPKPKVSWFLKYVNGTSLQLDIENSEILIKNIKRNSKIDKIECQVSNGYGPTASRSFKINIQHSPHFLTKSKVYRVPIRTHEVKLNCSIMSNPLAAVYWHFLPIGSFKHVIDYNSKMINDLNNIHMDENLSQQEWTLLNLIATYTYKYEENSSMVKLPLSKYQIYQKNISPNQINSILIIKMIDETDFGVYRCSASNFLGNKTIDFKIQELNHHGTYFDKMRSLVKENETENKNLSDKNNNKKQFQEKNLKHDEIYSYEDKTGEDNGETSFGTNSVEPIFDRYKKKEFNLLLIIFLILFYYKMFK